MKRILVLTADAGLGHRSAAEAVAAALEKRYGEEGSVRTANPLNDERVLAPIRSTQEAYDDLVKELPLLYELAYRATDAALLATAMKGGLMMALWGVMRDLIQDFKPHVIVSTFPFYQLAVQAIRMLEGREIPFITVVTDLAVGHKMWFDGISDLVVVPTEEARSLALAQGIPPEKVRIVGIPVDPAFAEVHGDRSGLREELGWKPERTTLLAVGSQRVDNLQEILHLLNHAALDLQLVLVAGGDDELHRYMQDTEWHVEAHVYGFTEKMPTLMQASDLVLCKAGGLIVTEALACGLPLLLVDVLPGQEEGNAEYVVEHGAGELVEEPEAALETVHHWLAEGGRVLAARAERAWQIGRPRAALEVAEIAWNAPEELAQDAKECCTRASRI